MNIYHNFDEIPFKPSTVITVGTFDGVHLGHKRIISRLLEIAAEGSYRDLLITFDPHPQIFLYKSGRKPVKLLTTVEERLELFKECGLDNILIVPFNFEFSQTPPEIFIEELLLKKVGMRKILLGHDHLFGKNREGNESLLKNLSGKFNFVIEKIEPEKAGKTVVSSTKIRAAIASGNINFANAMLGYYYTVSGKVIDGNKRGAKLGFPTANFELPPAEKLLPANGIYCVSSEIDGKTVFGLANIGFRPTFDNDNKIKLEVYYIDFYGNLYGKKLSISFIEFLRNEKKFNSAEELIIQMKKDEMEGRNKLYS